MRSLQSAHKMESHQVDSSSSPTVAAPDIQQSDTQVYTSTRDKSSVASSSVSSWAKILRNSQRSVQGDPQSGNAVMSTFARFTSGLGSHLSSKTSVQDETVDNPTTAQPGVVASLTKGLMDSSIHAVKTVQVKARHVVSQNKRRYQVVYQHCENQLSFDIIYYRLLFFVINLERL